MRSISFFLCLVFFMYHAPVYAYVGPGLGAGALAVVIGIVSSILLALFAIFWYPIKKLFRKSTKEDNSADDRAVVNSNTEKSNVEESESNSHDK